MWYCKIFPLLKAKTLTNLWLGLKAFARKKKKNKKNDQGQNQVLKSKWWVCPVVKASMWCLSIIFPLLDYTPIAFQDHWLNLCILALLKLLMHQMHYIVLLGQFTPKNSMVEESSGNMWNQKTILYLSKRYWEDRGIHTLPKCHKSSDLRPLISKLRSSSTKPDLIEKVTWSDGKERCGPKQVCIH